MCRYEITKVLGAGSFGVVREAVDRDTGRQYACKTVPKMPKRGKPTPRYLLKLQQEVDAMQQLGGSFDAVYLRVRNAFWSAGGVPDTLAQPPSFRLTRLHC
jgi:calcium-dependent protein kinase